MWSDKVFDIIGQYAYFSNCPSRPGETYKIKLDILESVSDTPFESYMAFRNDSILNPTVIQVFKNRTPVIVKSDKNKTKKLAKRFLSSLKNQQEMRINKLRVEYHKEVDDYGATEHAEKFVSKF
jgi:hypothetical protein